MAIWWVWFWVYGLFWWNVLYVPADNDKTLYNHNIGMFWVLVTMLIPFFYMSNTLQKTLQNKYQFSSTYYSDSETRYTSVYNNIALPQLASLTFLAFCICVPDSCEFFEICHYKKNTPGYGSVLVFVGIAEFLHLFVTLYNVYYLYDLDQRVESNFNIFILKEENDEKYGSLEMQTKDDKNRTD